MIVTHGGVELSSVDQPPAVDTHKFEYDPDTTDAGMAVVASLSEVLEQDPMTMAPLHELVDADALERLLASCEAVEVTLPVARYTVTVNGQGVVTVRPAPDADRRDQDTRQ